MKIGVWTHIICVLNNQIKGVNQESGVRAIAAQVAEFLHASGFAPPHIEQGLWRAATGAGIPRSLIGRPIGFSSICIKGGAHEV